MADIDLTATQQERDYRAAMGGQADRQTAPQTRGRTRAAVVEKTQRVRESRREKREGAKAVIAERQVAAEARKIDAKRQRVADKASAAAITKVAPGDMLKMLDQGLKQQKVCDGCPRPNLCPNPGNAMDCAIVLHEELVAWRWIHIVGIEPEFRVRVSGNNTAPVLQVRGGLMVPGSIRSSGRRDLDSLKGES